jgi:hypothetical protein
MTKPHCSTMRRACHRAASWLRSGPRPSPNPAAPRACRACRWRKPRPRPCRRERPRGFAPAWPTRQLPDLNACKVIEAGWSPQGQDWLLHIVLGLLGLIVAVALWFVAGARWMLGILVALAVSAWAVLDHAMTQAGRGVGTHAIEGLDPDKTYRWKVIVEDAEGNIVESQTRRLRVNP